MLIHHHVQYLFHIYGFDKANSWNTRFISEHGAFPFVIVWVWQWGAWKHAPIVILMPESHNLALVFMGIM